MSKALEMRQLADKTQAEAKSTPEYLVLLGLIREKATKGSHSLAVESDDYGHLRAALMSDGFSITTYSGPTPTMVIGW